MKKNPSSAVLFSLILSVVALILPTFTLAATVSLYDQPKADAKVVGNVDLSAGVIPIFSTPQGDWMKVGDPKNGNVGWVKAKDISGNSGTTSFSFTQKMINNGSGPQTYQIIQYGTPQKPSPEQMKALQALQLQQQRFQKEWQDMMNHFNHDLSDDFFMPGMHFPMIMPVVVVPVQKQAKPAPAQTPTQQTTTVKQK